MPNKKNDNSNQPSNVFVTTIPPNTAHKLREGLLDQGFEFTHPAHTEFLARKKGVSCTLYHSGKLVVQGKDKESFIEFYLEPEILGDFRYSIPEAADAQVDEQPRIGIDESGKGDFFGPLCIAGVFADAAAITRLKTLGVRDSKSLSDAKIRQLAPKIASQFIHYIVKISPPKYNQLYEKFGNLNSLLAWGHATAIEDLSRRCQCKAVIIDQFAHEGVVLRAIKSKNLQLDLKQMHKAESDPVVAAASILARHAYLMGLEKLEKECGLTLPKGASQLVIEAGKKVYNRGGKGLLEQVAKLHFKTTQSVIEEPVL